MLNGECPFFGDKPLPYCMLLMFSIITSQCHEHSILQPSALDGAKPVITKLWARSLMWASVVTQWVEVSSLGSDIPGGGLNPSNSTLSSKDHPIHGGGRRHLPNE